MRTYQRASLLQRLSTFSSMSVFFFNFNNLFVFRFRYEFKSQELWTELKLVLDNFASPLLDLFEGMNEQIPKKINNVHELKQVFEVLIMIAKLFYSLNYQVLKYNIYMHS